MEKWAPKYILHRSKYELQTARPLRRFPGGIHCNHEAAEWFHKSTAAEQLITTYSDCQAANRVGLRNPRKYNKSEEQQYFHIVIQGASGHSMT